MSISKFTTIGFGALVSLALATGGVAAAEPWSALGGVDAAPMNAAEMDAVQGKSAGTYFLSLAEQYGDQFQAFQVPGGGTVVGFWFTGTQVEPGCTNCFAPEDSVQGFNGN